MEHFLDFPISEGGHRGLFRGGVSGIEIDNKYTRNDGAVQNDEHANLRINLNYYLDVII